MLHHTMGRVYSNELCIIIEDFSLLIRTCTKKKKKKKTHCLYVYSPFFIEHVYRRVDLLHYVHMLERVRMRALSDPPFFQRFILMYFWVRI